VISTCGRALLETIALSLFIGDELKVLTDAADIASTDNFLNEHLFATRNEAVIGDGLGHRARSVLAYIDKLDKRMKGAEVRAAYEFMSEWCHPNGSGLLFTYGEIDKSTGTGHQGRPRRARHSHPRSSRLARCQATQDSGQHLSSAIAAALARAQ
jgi:hypothetical protein